MFDPARLVWTSRDEVTLLLTALDADAAHATTAMDLCQDIASPSAAPSLLAAARARDRPYWVRVHALRAHADVGAVVPDDALESFFAEWFFTHDTAPTYDVAAPGAFELHDLLAVVKTPAHERIAMRWLARSSPDVRAKALVLDAISSERVAPHTMAWLVDEWIAREGAGTSAENNLSVARLVCPDRAEALSVLWRHWAERPRDTATFADDCARVPGLAAMPSHPTERLRAATALHLSLDELLRALGPRGLRRAVHDVMIARSRQLAREDFSPAAECVAQRYRNALRVVRTWREGVGVATGLLHGVALAPAVRADLLDELLARDPRRAIERVAARLHADDDLPALRLVLQRLADSSRDAHGGLDATSSPVAHDPATGDAARALAWRALWVRDEAARYLAIDAVEALGATGPAWRETLGALAAGAHPLVRVRAWTSLARLGERDAVHALTVAAVGQRRVEVRAEAIRALGRLPTADDHVALFARTLTDDREAHGDDRLDAPASEQAALALACVGGARAMTALLRGAFGPVTNAAIGAIKAGLRVGVHEAVEPLSREARVRRVGVEEGWRLSHWSPRSPSRYGRYGE